MFTIEYVLDNAFTGVLRMDLIRMTYSTVDHEGVQVAFVVKCEDEEGGALGVINYEAPEGRSGRITGFNHLSNARRDHWATMIGDTISSWDDGWRVSSQRVVRLKTPVIKQTPDGVLNTHRWESLSPGILLSLINLARFEAAVNQYASDPRHGIDASWLLHHAAGQLRTMVSVKLADAVSDLRVF